MTAKLYNNVRHVVTNRKSGGDRNLSRKRLIATLISRRVRLDFEFRRASVQPRASAPGNEKERCDQMNFEPLLLLGLATCFENSQRLRFHGRDRRAGDAT